MKLDKTKADILRQCLIDVTQALRQEFADRDIGHFCLTCKASGRTVSGQAKLEFHVASDEYNTHPVRAPELLPAFQECLRRKGFNDTHCALALPAPGLEHEHDLQAHSHPDDDEIPL